MKWGNSYTLILTFTELQLRFIPPENNQLNLLSLEQGNFRIMKQLETLSRTLHLLEKNFLYQSWIAGRVLLGSLRPCTNEENRCKALDGCA